MSTFKKVSLAVLILGSLVTCKETDKVPQNKISETTISKTQKDFPGNYVTKEYHQRNEGYDWIAIAVREKGPNTIGISVRSRADKKRPTCTLDTKAYKVNDSLFSSVVNGVAVMFTFHKGILNISTERPEQEAALQFYCSGGGNFTGDYERIEGDLDRSQIDPTLFTKTLELQGIGFLVSSKAGNNEKVLEILPYGLEIDNSAIKLAIEGSIVEVEVEDLNSDGFPELLVYMSSDGSGSYGEVIGYSVNNGKSISPVYMPPITQDQKLSKGYMGHDEFSIIETSLVRRFPIYKDGDNNANPTGGIRQIEYKLEDGEASRLFVIKNSIDFPEL
ncbi:PliI family lysozyme inhibitor of I-type lysozyme [Eudoraea adriatica]|uniref:PliI family lysozyme inhibitor of I-type lysozyme n=1 Tax=Eudoraea adriatica TaxID=446681 RepID=UPI00035D670B|nr:PliI family lysozyme inhibitor of I-type lysozyme [Eudoraea adriatica]